MDKSHAFSSPDIQWGSLFEAVQLSGIFPDSKSFVDCRPRAAAATILAVWENERNQTNFNLHDFVSQWFDLPAETIVALPSHPSADARSHIRALWSSLTRQADADTTNEDTLLPLPHPYVVPGGRFREVYYWDSYFTMLGLLQDGHTDTAIAMLDNFAHLIDTVGHIPNGNRTYYLSRSQPPFFSVMVSLLQDYVDPNILGKYGPAMEKEYNFWMQGAEALRQEGSGADQRVVVVPLDYKGATVPFAANRYWDSAATPRPESYTEDVETAQAVSEADRAKLYTHLRAGAESGWDYSSRWLADGKTLSTIHTCDILPVDLNALLAQTEHLLERYHQHYGDIAKAKNYKQRWKQRVAFLDAYCWDEEAGFYMDYDFVKGQRTGVLSLAGFMPLFFELAEEEQAEAVVAVIEEQFLRPGGLMTTLHETGQQWDAPNGWAPLQWIVIDGLLNYDYDELAETITQRWLALNDRVFQETGKMMEKYNVCDLSLAGGGGEYPNQDGFGWTNGVYAKLHDDLYVD
ncbi:MAG: alpha,alpha-trehalase TreF [Saprospiraceae bacterium]